MGDVMAPSSDDHSPNTKQVNITSMIIPYYSYNFVLYSICVVGLVEKSSCGILKGRHAGHEQVCCMGGMRVVKYLTIGMVFLSRNNPECSHQHLISL